MWEIPDQAEMQRWVGQQLLGPIEDALSLARRYREVSAFQDYVGRRARMVIPVLVLIALTAVACGMVPIIALVGTSALSALAGLLLTPVLLLGSMLVLGLLFFSWLEERSLDRTLGRRRAREPGALRWMRNKLGADLGPRPRVPWLYAAVFLVLPFALLLSFVPVVAVVLLGLLAAAPVAFARLDRQARCAP